MKRLAHLFGMVFPWGWIVYEAVKSAAVLVKHASVSMGARQATAACISLTLLLLMLGWGLAAATVVLCRRWRGEEG